MADLLRIIGLWRGRLGWLVAGVLVSLLALAAGVGLMAVAGAALASLALFAPLMLRGLGTARVVLRYAERMVTHTAMFRALADLRVWLFRRLAANSAGGLGFRQAGDVLSRLVNDVEALDGVYLRVLVPLTGAVFLLPVTVWVIARGGRGWVAPVLAAVIGVLLVLAGFVLPWRAARATAGAGARLAVAMGQLRIAVLDTMTGWREVRAFGAEGRMLAAVQAREAALLGAQHALAARTALAGAGALLCAQAALFAVLCAAGSARVGAPGGTIIALFLVLAAFEVIGGLPRAGAYLGHAAAAAHRVLEAADAPVPVPDPVVPADVPVGSRLGFDAVSFRWRPELPLVFDGLTHGYRAGHAGGGARAVGVGQVDAGGSGVESGGAGGGARAAGPDRHRVTGGGRRAGADRLAEPDHAFVRRHHPEQSFVGAAGR